MRIQGGRWRGRELIRPKTPDVRPISAMVCQALFNILGPLEGKRFLDAYAGSGAIGFEALSRGAGEVVAVEMLPAAISAIRENARALEVGNQHKLAPMSIERWLSSQNEKFDVIVAGPPFAKLDESVLDELAGLLAANGELVAWHSSRLSAPELKSVELKSSRIYGDSALSFYT
jgi:16S rRNA (guanine966-N2)-methyltransferase